jgi:hypothetical protein
VFAQGIAFDGGAWTCASSHHRHCHAHPGRAQFALDVFERAGRDLGLRAKRVPASDPARYAEPDMMTTPRARGRAGCPDARNCERRQQPVQPTEQGQTFLSALEADSAARRHRLRTTACSPKPQTAVRERLHS